MVEERTTAAVGTPEGSLAPAVEMRGICKAFGGVLALDDVSLDVRHGEIHALLGGNGAGKSTLLKILRGVHAPDQGVIEVDGVPLTDHTAKAARRAGIAMIFQEMSLVPSLTAAQNVFLNREPKTRIGLIDDADCRQASRALFQDFKIDVDPDQPVATLGAGQRQLIEIIKAISENSRILVLDEPSSALTETEVGRLFDMLRRLKDSGVAIIYVSHRMDEIMRIADRATVLRDGHNVMTAPMTDLTVETLVNHIVGQEGHDLTIAPSDSETVLGEPFLELRGVCGPGKPTDIDLVVHSGEVVGVAGLLGSGRSSLARLLYGITPLRAGEVRVKGKPARFRRPGDAIADHIALIPEDRLRQGLVVQHSIADNVCLPILDRLSRWTFVLAGAAAQIVHEQMASLRIKADSPAAPASSLSGGNQQKVVLAKGLATQPDILVLDEPTAGIDIGSKTEIVGVIRDMVRQGKAVLLISSEMSELLSASDRIVVMADGRIKAELNRDDLFPETIDPTESFQEAQRRLHVAIQEANAND